MQLKLTSTVRNVHKISDFIVSKLCQKVLISSLEWAPVQVRWLSNFQVIEHFQGKFKHRSVSESEIYEMHFWQLQIG